MAVNNISVGDSGSKAMRVLDALTPKIGTAAPTMNADYIGQIYVKNRFWKSICVCG